ncbi:hypothetical protein HX867_23430 [Pseudomonas gingeri]|uniref:hypothetical protein n=1 Tax=Pseudomonas gingeri TaxID=117681 RepID=UPI0015A432DA|nr:hypothetical protein [Pseudomonas gingeri]NVZ65064.1 hypothetical protein [Pseudomonas gingeri]NVZ77930.1 hypothetical protein [Pseudomonas gingeri]
MLTIRRAQLKIFEDVAISRFETRLLERLRRVFPAHVAALPEAELHLALRQGLAKARQYRMISEVDTVMFLDLLFGLAADFDERPEHRWIIELLDDPRLPAYAALDLIYQQLPQRSEPLV